MYRRPKFLEVLLEIRREMAREADYDVVLFSENIRSGKRGIDIENKNVNNSSSVGIAKAPQEQEALKTFKSNK